MPEETDVSNEPGGRRSKREAESDSGGGGKVLIIFLAVLLALVGFILYKRHTGASAQAEKDLQSINTLSNQVGELKTKMLLEHSDVGLAQSNHQALLNRRTVELTTVSNRFVQTSLILSNTQQELHILQDNLATKISSLAALEARQSELDRQAIAIPVLQHEVAELKDKLVQAQFTQAALEESLGRARLEKAELERLLDDPAFLRMQMEKAEDNAAVRKQMAAGGRIDASDPRLRLTLQPDGTVRPWIETNRPPAKAK